MCFTPTKVAPTESNGTIGDYAFSYCDNLYRITIPENIGFISSLAFYGSYHLEWIDVSSGNTRLASEFGILYDKNITKLICYPPGYYGYFYDNNFIVPDTVTVIGSNAFNGVHLLCNVILPDGVTAIENNAFSGCYNLGAITIPDSVTTIETYAFARSGIINITIPEGVSCIDRAVFSGCSDLKTVILPQNLKYINDLAFLSCGAW